MTQSISRYRVEAAALLKLGLPLVGSSIAGFLIHMVDTLMLGWYSVTALAASTLASSLFFTIFTLGAGFGFAVMPMVAAAEDDETRIRRVTRMGMWLSVGFAIFVLPLFWWSGPIFLAIGQKPEVAAEAQAYLRIVGWGMFPALINAVIRSFLSAQNMTGAQLWVTVAAIFMNAAINYALIFGNLGAPELGIRGAAIASVIVQTVTVAILIVYALYKRPQMHLLQRIWKPDSEIMREVFVLGLPIGFTALAETGLFAFSAIMMGWIGKVELAAHGIALQLAALTFMFHIGMSQAATIRAGKAYGRKAEADLRMTARIAMAVAFAFACGVVVVFLSVPEFLVSLFIDPTEPERAQLLTIGVSLLFMATLFQFVDATQVNAIALLRGVQDTVVPMWLAGFSYWVVGLPAGYVFAFVMGWGAIGLWLGLTAGLATAAGLLMYRFWNRSVRIGVELA